MRWRDFFDRSELSKLLLPRILLSVSGGASGGAGAGSSAGSGAAAGSSSASSEPPSPPDFKDDRHWRQYAHYRVYIGTKEYKDDEYAWRLVEGMHRFRERFESSLFRSWAVCHCNSSLKLLTRDRTADVQWLKERGVNIAWNEVNAVTIDRDRGTFSVCVDERCRLYNDNLRRNPPVIEREGKRNLVAPTTHLSVLGLEKLQQSIQYGISGAGMATITTESVETTTSMKAAKVRLKPFVVVVAVLFKLLLVER